MAKNQQKSKQETARASASDENLLVKQRRQKASQINELGFGLYPNTFRPRDSIGGLIKQHGQLDAARLESQRSSVMARSPKDRAFLAPRSRPFQKSLH